MGVAVFEFSVMNYRVKAPCPETLPSTDPTVIVPQTASLPLMALYTEVHGVIDAEVILKIGSIQLMTTQTG